MKQHKVPWYYRRDHWLSRILDAILITDLLALALGSALAAIAFYTIQDYITKPKEEKNDATSTQVEQTGETKQPDKKRTARPEADR